MSITLQAIRRLSAAPLRGPACCCKTHAPVANMFSHDGARGSQAAVMMLHSSIQCRYNARGCYVRSMLHKGC